eukprot:CAMPEP_0197235584 /NCGR_PEP_ID=MMETSP1429-20130617/2979_1 /TAXON_ID=49237 /ORGANISM="Chaetoceros  sp., Strain UNC1202" /LENGTH=38 /DNA_ID= /DNA_START= /DNA_END= /DNA_ORIENTATION=
MGLQKKSAIAPAIIADDMCTIGPATVLALAAPELSLLL